MSGTCFTLLIYYIFLFFYISNIKIYYLLVLHFVPSYTLPEFVEPLHVFFHFLILLKIVDLKNKYICMFINY